MKDAQYAEIIRRLTRIEASQKQLARSLKIHDMKADGLADADLPWLRLSPGRARQITRVREELTARCARLGGNKQMALTGAALTAACEAVHTPTANGYPSVKALRCACCRVRVMDFV